MISIFCPECGFELRLPDRSMLGRKGRCPHCQHGFVMEEPKAPSPPPKPKPLPKPPAPAPKPEEVEDGTLWGPPLPGDQTEFAPSPFPEPLASDFEDLQDLDPADEDSQIGDLNSATVIGPVPAAIRDSAPVPEGFFDELSDVKPSAASGTSDGGLKTKPAGGTSISVRMDWTGNLARCPNCHTPVQFTRDDELPDLLCPRCQTRFSLIHPESPGNPASMPFQVGTYPLQTRVGVGPFGNTYRAQDGQLQHAVAIKVARGDQLEPGEIDRFLTTIREVMQLKHPNLVTLHEVEQAEGRVYLVSDFVEGIDLSDYLVDRRLSIREIASLCAQMASGLHNAHKFGVVHGNLKPTNVRLDAGLQPKILDFALNRRPKGGVKLTGNGRIIGTAAYLAPEQLHGGREATALSDVFALGVILYEMLTGRRPFPGQGRELLKQIAKGVPPSPRSIDATVPKPLEVICMKCLENHPKDRYQSVMDVARELRRYLEDVPILTKPPGLMTRFGRWCRRRPLMAGMLFGLLAAALLGIGFLAWQSQRVS